MTDGVTAIPRIVRRQLVAPGTLANAIVAGGEAASLFPHPVGAPASTEPGGVARLPGSALLLTRPSASDRLAAILDGRGVAVTTGQQPGLFLGPLYTLYKAVTAVRVAADIERRSGVPALAVFWTASDDHDWDEVAACRVLGPDEELMTLRLAAPPGREGNSVGTSPLPEDVTGLVRELRSLLDGGVPGTPPRWIDDLAEAYRPGQTFGAAFGAALASALGEVEAAILDSGHPALRRAAAPFYGRLLDSPDRVVEAMAAGRAAVEGRGFAPALTPPVDGLQLFRDAGQGRVHLRRNEEFDPVALHAALGRSPEEFTPAAALRPVVESWLLPVAASVLGPGEIAYWAQLAPLFDAFEVEMPRIVPRDAWTLVEPRVDRLLDKLDLTVDDVERQGEALDDRWVSAHRPPETESGLEAVRSAMGGHVDQLDDVIGRELPGLRSAVAKLGHRWAQALTEFETTVDARVAEEQGVALGQLARVRAHLLPGGDPQERVVGAAQALAGHGRPLTAALLAASRVAGSRDPD